MKIMGNVTVSSEEIKRLKGLGFLHNKGTDCFSGRVITGNGKITADQHVAIGEAAKKFGNGNVLYTTRLTVEVQGIPYEKTEEFCEYVKAAGLSVGGTGAKVRPVVSCKGTTCQYGLLDTYALSDEIHKRFYEGYHDVVLPHKFKIAVGGCPNNCVKPDLNDLGIVGQLIPVLDEKLCKGCKKCGVETVCPVDAAKVENGLLCIDDKKCINCGRCVAKCHFSALSESKPGYKIYIGGRWGKSVAQGRPLDHIFTSEEVMDLIEKAILLFKEQGRAGERFCQTMERIGFEEVQKQLLS